MSRLINPLRFEDGLDDLIPPQAMTLQRDISRTVLVPFAATGAVGQQEAAKGIFTRCDAKGATLIRDRAVFTLVTTTEFTLDDGTRWLVLAQDPQIDAFSFRFVIDNGANMVEWRVAANGSVLTEMTPGTNYFRWVKAKQLVFQIDAFMGPACICELKTYRYQ